MAQQLNLLAPQLAPPALRFSARQGLWLLAGLALATGLGVQGLRWASLNAAAQSHDLATRMLPLQAQHRTLTARLDSGPGSGAAGELAQLRSVESGQRRISAALTSGPIGAREGPADYLVALARRTSGSLWITGFAVSEDGSAVELEGRMTDPAALTDYLRGLNGEPRFKGRPFAQLSLKSMAGSEAASPYTEFSLRSNSTPSSTTSGAAPNHPGASGAEPR